MWKVLVLVGGHDITDVSTADKVQMTLPDMPNCSFFSSLLLYLFSDIYLFFIKLSRAQSISRGVPFSVPGVCWSLFPVVTTYSWLISGKYKQSMGERERTIRSRSPEILFICPAVAERFCPVAWGAWRVSAVRPSPLVSWKRKKIEDNIG